MDPVTLSLLAGAGLGLYKSEQDKQREAADRKVAAATARWSPWTGMQAQPVQRSDQMGAVMQGGLQGAAFGQGLEQRAAYQDWLKKQNQFGAMDAQGVDASNQPPMPMNNLYGMQNPYLMMS